MTDPGDRAEERFVTKRDLWLTLVIWGAVLLCAASAYRLYSEGGGLLAHFVAVQLIAIVPLGLYMLYGTHYTLSDDRLLVRSGVLKWSIRLQAITRIQPSRDIRSSPACSLDRLLIVYAGGQRLLISPRDKDGFIDAILARVSHLKRSDDSVVDEHSAS